MSSQLKERCIYCGADVYYTGNEQLIKCGMCGHTLVVAKFENELARMNAALEEGEAAKRELEAAEKEKQAADDRLFAALSELDSIEAGQNMGLRVLQKIASDGEDAGSRLALLRTLSDQIVNTQEDILGKLQMQTEIVSRLQTMEMEAGERQKLMADFMLWCQTAQTEDYDRLKDISSSAALLLKEQKAVESKVDQLQQTADRTQQILEDFRTRYTQDKLERLKGLWRQAENCQHDRDYDKAAEYYRQVAVEGGTDAEVCWRLLLCHYCISYQQDGDGRFIPIILNPDLTDPEEMALRRELQPFLQAPDGARYRDELAVIDRILEKYRRLKDDVKYEIFISVKQSGEDGHPTIDSDKAFELYYHLTDMGFKVFNSRVCKAELVAAGEYEPYIISALMSSRVLIVLGTCRENMNAQWVKNEWSRFQWLMKKEQENKGSTDRILLCYLAGEMRSYDIPLALNRKKQAITEGPTTDEQLRQALAPLRAKKGSAAAVAAPVYQAKPEETVNQILNQMTVWLFTGEYGKVLDKYEQLKASGKYLDQPQIHILALCAGKEVEDIGMIVRSDTDLGSESLFKLAMLFARGSELEDKLKRYLEQNGKWRSAAEGKQRADDIPAAPVVTGSMTERREAVQALANVLQQISSRRYAAVVSEKDQFENIIESVKNGTYRRKLRLGDTRKIDLNGRWGSLTMELVAFDADELWNGSGKAATTWVARTPLKYLNYMNPELVSSSIAFLKKYKEGTGAIGGWKQSAMRYYLIDKILPVMPEYIRKEIKAVRKYSVSKDMSGYTDTISCTMDGIWIPSAREVGLVKDREIKGPDYSERLGAKDARIRFKNEDHTPTWWWLRTAASYSEFTAVTEKGGIYARMSGQPGGIIIGFCI